MEETKTYVFGQDNNLVSALIPFLSQKGVDPGMLSLLNNGNFGGNGGWFIWILFLFIFMCWGRNGFGNGDGNGTGFLASQLNNDYGRDVLLQAINGNGNAISQLATTLNCDINAVQGAVNAVRSSVEAVGNQVGMTGLQVTNAIQAGDCSLASQIAQCCCENKLLVTQQGYESRIATLEQTNSLSRQADVNTRAITDAIQAQSTMIVDKFCEVEKRDLQNKIDTLRSRNETLVAQIDNANQTAAINSYITSLVAPIQAEVTSIKNTLPATVSVPYYPYTIIPNTTYGYSTYGYNTGCGCNQGSIWA